jgi:hypothetical protein
MGNARVNDFHVHGVEAVTAEAECGGRSFWLKIDLGGFQVVAFPENGGAGFDYLKRLAAAINAVPLVVEADPSAQSLTPARQAVAA